jgi:hypothetical protein
MSTAPSTADDGFAAITLLVQAATSFTSRDRAEATMRKWLTASAPPDISPAQLAARVEEAVTLSADLLLSQPSASGATAFDRLANSQTGAAADKTALAALRRARFRLLRLDETTRTARDEVSGAVLRLAGRLAAKLPVGLHLFVRLAVMEDGRCVPAGPVTPLDTLAAMRATTHPAAGAPGAAANARWAESVYAHVVRHGTLDVPGLNRPGAGGQPDLFEDETHPIIVTAREWVALAGAAPGPDLLRRTRLLASLQGILNAFSGMAMAQQAGDSPLAKALEQVALVLMETVLRRESCGAGTLTLDEVAQAIGAHIARRQLPADAPARFTALRQRLAARALGSGADDPELARLVQRIQGLRAKTVAHGCTEQEALAAAEKVAELLDRYGLSLGELDFRAQPCDGIAVQTDRRRRAPIDNCIGHIAAFFDCRVWAEQTEGEPYRYIFFGLRADVAAAQYLYEMVEQAFETETNAFRAGEMYANMAGERRSATNSFQIGLATGIITKLQTLLAARATRSTTGRDLVAAKATLVDEEMEKLGLDLRPRGRAGAKRVLSDAFAAGEQAGERFEVVTGIREAA